MPILQIRKLNLSKISEHKIRIFTMVPKLLCHNELYVLSILHFASHYWNLHVASHTEFIPDIVEGY